MFVVRIKKENFFTQNLLCAEQARSATTVRELKQFAFRAFGQHEVKN